LLTEQLINFDKGNESRRPWGTSVEGSMKQNRRGIIAIVSPAAWLIHSRTARMLNRIECFTDSIRFRGEIKPLTVGVKTDACRF